jgi:microcystin-dependent protein
MHRTNRPHRLVIALAVAGVLGFTATRAVQAAPITGDGVPIDIEQPSLGVTYLVRTQDPTNIADVGQVVAFAGSVVPGGFAVANGQLLPIIDNQVLFSQIGTTYGGNGINNFALPNLSGRSVVGTGQGAGLTNRPLGSVAGAPTQTLTASELPAYGGASGVTAGSTPLSTLQPSLALNEGLVAQGFFPVPNGPQAQGPVIGQVLTYAGSSLPNGQVAANGQLLPISQNQALFSVIGNTYGGNSFVNFATPNLAGREATGAGAAPGLTPQSLGATAGSASTVLTVANLPPQPLTLANGTKAVVGGGQPINLMQPTLALQYIVAVQGVFPTSQSIVPDGVPFLGEISLFAGTVAPTGWDFADGQLLSIAANQALFAVIGTTYGGNGTFDFALPNLEDRIAVGTGDGVTLGEAFGSDSAYLNFAQLPVGYPAALPVTATVPEPPAIAILLVGLVGLACRKAARRSGELKEGQGLCP